MDFEPYGILSNVRIISVCMRATDKYSDRNIHTTMYAQIFWIAYKK